jgi:hypothetical protein
MPTSPAISSPRRIASCDSLRSFFMMNATAGMVPAEPNVRAVTASRPAALR